MKFRLLTVLLVQVLTSQGAKAGAFFSTAGLKPGQCVSDPESKNYLQSMRASKSGAFNQLISELGEKRFQSFQNTENSYYYFCQVTCADLNGSLEKIWVTHTDSPSNFSNMNGFSCHSVSIEDRVIVGSIRGPQPVATPFYAYDTGFEELHRWLKSKNFILSPQAEADRRLQLQQDLKLVSSAYLRSSSPVFIQAGAELREMAYDPELGKLKLNQRAQIYVKQNWQMPMDFQNPEFVIFNSLRSMARFLEYTQAVDAKSP